MHIFRWLMTHPIITAWILAALAILLNMGTKNGHEDTQHAVEQQTAHEVVGSESKAVTDTSTSTSSQSEASSHEAAIVSTGNTELAAAGQAVVVQQDQGGSLDVSTAITTSEQTTHTQVNTEQTNDAQPVQASQNMGDGLSAMKTEDLVQLAREAFWQNKKDISVAIYKVLVQREPESLSHKGELANVYWHLNKQKESAALYAEIAEPMIKAGKSNEVANMLGFIGVYFPEKVQELQRLISQ